MKLSAVVLVLLAAAGCVKPPSDSLPAPLANDIPQLRSDSPSWEAVHYTVRVRNLTCDGLGVGSGFLLDNKTLVTNRHVVAGATALSVSTWDGKELAVDAESVASVADLAVIRLREPAGPVADLAGADPAVGADVMAVGYPLAGRVTVTSGEVLGYVDGAGLGNTGQVLEIDALVRPGNSGGPLIDSSGDVVGVVYATNRLSHSGLAVPISMLQSVLDRSGFSAPEPTC